MRRTKILATLGPASADAATVHELIAAGVDAVRLNFSHGTPEGHARTLAIVREVAEARRATIGVMQDLAGPKLRVGEISSPQLLAEGDSLTLAEGDVAPEGHVPCNVEALFTSVPPGAHLLFDDGRIDVVVTAVSPGRLVTRVVVGGLLSSHKGINVPGIALRMSAMTPKDEADLRAGLAMGVDMVALSFVQSPSDVLDARRIASDAGVSDVPIFAKIERPGAVALVDAIVDAADGIIVARGDLGIETPLEQLPGVQRRLVAAARKRGKPVIIATQVLESMVHDPRPTRAEVTDAAHAVDEGVDAIMLAGETAAGRYPVRAVQMLGAIVVDAERERIAPARVPEAFASKAAHAGALAESAVMLAERAGAAAIVAITRHGETARALAAWRPRAPILAVTASPRTAARLSLIWGVTAVVTDAVSRPAIHAALDAGGHARAGATVVVATLRPAIDSHGANMVQLVRI